MFSCALTLQCFASDSSAWGGRPHEFLTRITCCVLICIILCVSCFNSQCVCFIIVLYRVTLILFFTNFIINDLFASYCIIHVIAFRGCHRQPLYCFHLDFQCVMLIQYTYVYIYIYIYIYLKKSPIIENLYNSNREV